MSPSRFEHSKIHFQQIVKVVYLDFDCYSTVVDFVYFLKFPRTVDSACQPVEMVEYRIRVADQFLQVLPL